MRARALLLPVLAGALVLPGLAATAGTGQAAPATSERPAAGAVTGNPARALVRTLAPHAEPTPSATGPGSEGPLFLSAKLAGKNEVPPAAAAKATAAVEIDGATVTFAVEWKNTPAPTAGHIHRGGSGVNGPVVVPLFITPMPAGSTAGAGYASIDDVALADDIRAHPSSYYVNLHTAAFPGGAARGQLKVDDHGFDGITMFTGLPLEAEMDGGSEVPGPGDPDGYAYGAVAASGSKVRYAFAWLGLTPTMAHIHQGGPDVAGPVRVPLIDGAVPDTLFAVAGEMPLDRGTRKALRQDPTAFYLNLHSAQFPAGAVRGQLSAGAQ